MNAAELAARSERVFVVEAMKRQASTLDVHSRYPHEGVVEHPERLVDLVFGRAHTDAFVAACEKTVRELH